MVGGSLENDYHTPKPLGMQAAFLKFSGNNGKMSERAAADLSEILLLTGAV